MTARVFLMFTLLVTAGGWGSGLRATRAANPLPVRQAARTDSMARAPKGSRIRVRVLNTTSTKGLAKRMTFLLRDLGYDVVDFDSDRRSPRTSTLILSHTAHDEWAQRLRRAVGMGAVETRSDSLRYVDFTVLIGRDWKPTAQPFRP